MAIEFSVLQSFYFSNISPLLQTQLLDRISKKTVQRLTEKALLSFVASVSCQYFAEFFHTCQNVHLCFLTSVDSLQYLFTILWFH